MTDMSSMSNASRQTRKDMADVITNLRRLVANLEEATPEALLYALKPAFDLSQIYVPEDTGELKDSGYLEVAGRGKTPSVEIGYGRGGQPEYAAIVHEDLEMKHKSPTRAKFLEVALRECEELIRKRIVSYLKRAMAGNSGTGAEV